MWLSDEPAWLFVCLYNVIVLEKGRQTFCKELSALLPHTVTVYAPNYLLSLAQQKDKRFCLERLSVNIRRLPTLTVMNLAIWSLNICNRILISYSIKRLRSRGAGGGQSSGRLAGPRHLSAASLTFRRRATPVSPSAELHLPWRGSAVGRGFI